jgi:hypothetical protein
VSRARAPSRWANATSTSGSCSTVVENRTFGVLPFLIPDEEERAVCGPSEIAHLYSALLRYVDEGASSWSPISLEGRLCLALFTLSNMGFGEHPF